MYEIIDNHRSVRKLYTERLVRRGDISIEQAEEFLGDFESRLEAAFDETKQARRPSHRRRSGRRRRGAAAARRHRRRKDRSTGSRRPVRRPGRVHPPPQARPHLQEGPRALRRGHRLGAGRDARVRVAAARGHQRPARRPGLAPRHLLAAPRGPGRLQTGDEYLPLANLADDQGKWFIYDSLLSEYAALGFEYGYSVEAKDARLLGGPVRRLRQRRPDHHRPVHRRRRGQVGRDLRARPAAAARLRGPGPRAQLGPDRAVPHPVRRGQHPGRQRHHRGPVLPRPAPPDAPRRPQAAGDLHAEVAAAVPERVLADIAEFTSGSFRETLDDPKVDAVARTATATRPGPSCCAPARSPTT
jgi:hypothetical protein